MYPLSTMGLRHYDACRVADRVANRPMDRRPFGPCLHVDIAPPWCPTLSDDGIVIMNNLSGSDDEIEVLNHLQAAKRLRKTPQFENRFHVISTLRVPSRP